MRRYFFNVITDTETIIDTDGILLPSLASARAEGESAAREILAGAIRAGGCPPQAVRICDENGDELAIVPLKSLIPRTLK